MKVKNMVLSSEDICKIIKECAKSGVIDLKMGEVSISFSGKKVWDEVELSVVEAPKEETSVEKENKLEVTREDYLQQLLIEDPYQYEKVINQGDILDA